MPKLVPLSEKLARYKKLQEAKAKKKKARYQKNYTKRQAKIPKLPKDIFADLPLDTKLPILPIEPRGLLGKAGDEPVMPPPAVCRIRSSVKWPSIQRDIWNGWRTNVQIAEDYNIRREDGSLDIITIAKYRIWLKAQYHPIFELSDQLEKKALRKMVEGFVEQTHAACMTGVEKAMTLTQRVKVGTPENSRIELVDNPNLEAANNFLQTALAAAKAFADLTGMSAQMNTAPAHGPITVDARKQRFDVMVMPKTTDIISMAAGQVIPSAPAQVVDVEPNILDILNSMPDDDSPPV